MTRNAPFLLPPKCHHAKHRNGYNAFYFRGFYPKGQVTSMENVKKMDMTREVFMYAHDAENGGLIRINPTNEEALMGRRMCSTLHLMCREVNKRGSHGIDTSIGRIEITVNNRKKGRGIVLNMPNGELKYHEVRNFIVLAVQYACGEFPLLQVDFDGKRATINLNSGRDIVNAFAGV